MDSRGRNASRRVDLVVLGEERFFARVLREHEEHEDGAKCDGKESRRVSPVLAIDEGRFGAGDDRVLRLWRIATREVARTGERLRQCRLGALADVGRLWRIRQ